MLNVSDKKHNTILHVLYVCLKYKIATRRLKESRLHLVLKTFAERLFVILRLSVNTIYKARKLLVKLNGDIVSINLGC